MLFEWKLKGLFVVKGLASLAISHLCAKASKIFNVVIDGRPAFFEAGGQFLRGAGASSVDEAMEPFDVFYSFCEIHKSLF